LNYSPAILNRIYHKPGLLSRNNAICKGQ